MYNSHIINDIEALMSINKYEKNINICTFDEYFDTLWSNENRIK